MALSSDEVRWIAHLARLTLTETEVATMTHQLDAILEYVNQLQRVDTSAVEPLAHPLSLQNVFREDQPADSHPVADAVANAPDRRGDFFGVPAVFD